jgi:hypothetical protein
MVQVMKTVIKFTPKFLHRTNSQSHNILEQIYNLLLS